MTDPVRPEPPIKWVHLGPGVFFRAHQAWYTHHATDGSDWPIAVFAGRSPRIVDVLNAQQGKYTLMTIEGRTERFETISQIGAAHASDDARAWQGYFASKELSVVTLTVTEPAYLHDPVRGADWDSAELLRDVATIRSGGDAVTTVPARLALGLLIRRQHDGGRLTISSCDNLPNNGAVLGSILRSVCSEIDPSLGTWVDEMVSFPSSVVDRISPQMTADALDRVEQHVGYRDEAAVKAESYAEWTFTDDYITRRPDWESAGASCVPRIEPFERRKLWLLNAAHTILALSGIRRGYVAVHETMSDPNCVALVREWWSIARVHIDLPQSDLLTFCENLELRFQNAGIDHQLHQVATDSEFKLRIRIVPLLHQEREQGRLPEVAIEVLAAWVWFVRSQSRRQDVGFERLREVGSGSAEAAVRGLLGVLHADLADDVELCRAVVVRLVAFEG